MSPSTRMTSASPPTMSIVSDELAFAAAGAIRARARFAAGFVGPRRRLLLDHGSFGLPGRGLAHRSRRRWRRLLPDHVGSLGRGRRRRRGRRGRGRRGRLYGRRRWWWRLNLSGRLRGRLRLSAGPGARHRFGPRSLRSGRRGLGSRALRERRCRRQPGLCSPAQTASKPAAATIVQSASRSPPGCSGLRS